MIEPFSASPLRAGAPDSTRASVTWTGGSLRRSLPVETVRFRFYLEGGRLYAFWVSPSARGESRGYVAAGGPAFGGPIDTAGG